MPEHDVDAVDAVDAIDAVDAVDAVDADAVDVEVDGRRRCLSMLLTPLTLLTPTPKSSRARRPT
eukprot:7084864-Heterocapsa_arctica.AAC.1